MKHNLRVTLLVASLLLLVAAGMSLVIGSLGIAGDMRNVPLTLCSKGYDPNTAPPGTVLNMENPEISDTSLPIAGKACTYQLASGETYVATSSWVATILVGSGLLAIILAIAMNLVSRRIAKGQVLNSGQI